MPIPFGPYLVGGGIAAIFFGQPLTQLWFPTPLKPLHIGLTGGIGSGKSTVATMLVACGALLVDTDAIAHALTAPGGAALPALAQAFGPDIIAADGAHGPQPHARAGLRRCRRRGGGSKPSCTR